MLDEYTYMNQNALQQLQKQGVEIRPYPSSVIEELRKISNEVLAENSKADPRTKKYTSLILNIKRAEAYHKISEQAYYEIR